jgi:short-subunit dehydrogenase
MNQPSSPLPVALITGASAGIGAAVARRLARQGYAVALAARRQERLDALAGELIAAGGQALALTADVSRLDDVQRMAADTLARFGRIDVLVNNAGFGRLGWLETLDPEKDVQYQIQVDLVGLIWTAQAVLPHMIARRRGHIINVGSMAGYIGTPTYTVYDAAKFGVRGFTDALRRETRSQGIHVSGLYPGPVATEFGQAAHVGRRLGPSSPGWLELSADDVAEAVWQLVRRPRREIIQPGIMRWAVALNALFPSLIDVAVQRIYKR